MHKEPFEPDEVYELSRSELEAQYDDGFSSGWVVGIFCGFAIALLGVAVW